MYDLEERDVLMCVRVYVCARVTKLVCVCVGNINSILVRVLFMWMKYTMRSLLETSKPKFISTRHFLWHTESDETHEKTKQTTSGETKKQATI